MKTYNPDSVTLKIGGKEFKGFGEGAFIEIKPYEENPELCNLSDLKKEVTIDLSLDPDGSYRKWTEYFLGRWENENNDTENN